MIQLELNALIEHLRQSGYEATLQSKTQQIYILLRIADKEFPLFVRIFDKSSLLQLLVFLPMKIKPGVQGDLARLLHQINSDLDIPGYGMDETAGLVFYRCMLPALDKTVQGNVLDAYLKSIKLICETISSPIFAVASGMASYADILRQAKEIRNKNL